LYLRINDLNSLIKVKEKTYAFFGFSNKTSRTGHPRKSSIVIATDQDFYLSGFQPLKCGVEPFTGLRFTSPWAFIFLPFRQWFVANVYFKSRHDVILQNMP